VWTQLAVERYFKDLEREGTDAFPFFFDADAADFCLNFFTYLHHSKGEWAGQVFHLAPWQQFGLWNIFGWLSIEDRMRRFKTFYLEVARKNGKTTMAAGLGLYLLDGDGEPGAEIYSAATKFDQAKISHEEATRMVKSSPDLADHIRVHTNNLFVLETDSFFRPLGRDHDTLDGLNVHGALVDEVHAHKTRDLWDIIETATGSRRQPLIVAITTAGFNKQSICFELHDYSQKILEGTLADETFMAMIYTIDKDDDWADERNWIKANPNLNVSVKIDDLRRKAGKAAAIPSALNTFKRLHLNIWTDAESTWIPAEAWNLCGKPFSEDALRGRMCYSGLDLSSTKDITALVHVFPPMTENDVYHVICRFFLPRQNLMNRVRNDRVPYDAWEAAGYIITTPGKRINYDWIHNQISADAERFDIREIAYDRWGATKVVQDLADLGFEKENENKYASRFLIDFGQGYISMSAPMKELEALILEQKMAHGGNPVLAWMCSNVHATEDPAGNIKPDKGKSIERIDGIVALIMALDRAIRKKNAGNTYPEPSFI